MLTYFVAVTVNPLAVVSGTAVLRLLALTLPRGLRLKLGIFGISVCEQTKAKPKTETLRQQKMAFEAVDNN